MKTFVTALSLILLGALAYYFKPVSIPSGMVLVNKTFLDSLGNVKPDTVTVITKGDPYPVEVTVYVPVPQEEDSTRVFYKDSLVNSKLAVFVSDTIQKKTGKILFRKLQYQLFVPERTETIITKPFPMPYAVEKPAKEWRYFGKVWIGNGFQGEGGVIYKDRFIFGAKAGVKSVEVGAGLIF